MDDSFTKAEQENCVAYVFQHIGDFYSFLFKLWWQTDIIIN